MSVVSSSSSSSLVTGRRRRRVVASIFVLPLRPSPIIAYAVVVAGTRRNAASRARPPTRGFSAVRWGHTANAVATCGRSSVVADRRVVRAPNERSQRFARWWWWRSSAPATTAGNSNAHLHFYLYLSSPLPAHRKDRFKRSNCIVAPVVVFPVDYDRLEAMNYPYLLCHVCMVSCEFSLSAQCL